MRNDTLPRALTAAAALALLAACSPTERQQARQETSQAAQSAGQTAGNAADRVGKAAESAVEKADDAAVTAKVKSALLADDQVKGLQINVDTSNGTVTLSGTAKSANEKQRAEQVATAVEGVRGVQNRISVQGG